MAESNIIAKKPNAFIQTWQDGNLFQSKALIWMLSEFKFHARHDQTPASLGDLASKVYEIPLSSLMPDYRKARGGTLITRVEKAFSKVMSAQLTVDEERGKTMYNLMSYMRLKEGTTTIEAKFNVDIVPVMVDMVNSGYTEIPLMDIRPLKNVYSVRVYELLLKNRKLPHVMKEGYIIPLNEFRFLLNISEDMYPAFGGFNNRVLKKVHQEINELTTLRYEYDFIKVGRKVEKLRFYDIAIVSPFTENDTISPTAEQTELFEAMDPLSLLKPKSAIEIKDMHSTAYIAYYHKKAMDIKNSGGVKRNFPGLFYTLLTEDPDKFYALEKRLKAEADAEDAKRAKREKEKLAEAKAQELIDRQYELAFTAAEEKFNALPAEQQEALLAKIREENPILTESFVRRSAIDSLMEK